LNAFVAKKKKPEKHKRRSAHRTSREMLLFPGTKKEEGKEKQKL